MSNSFRTLLVIGDNHEEIVKKYSLDTMVQPYLRYKFDDKSKYHIDQMKVLEKQIQTTQDTNSKLSNMYKELYKKTSEMDDFEFYQELTAGCIYDDNGNAWSVENPNAYYQFEKCYDKRIREDQRNEAPFSNPFILKDGTKAYSAKMKDIDWSKNHMINVDMYRTTWEICVEGRQPENQEEQLIYDSLHLKQVYFENFDNIDTYIAHNCSFWTYGIATENEYICGKQDTAIEWTTHFFDKYIKDLPEETVLTIYEIKLID